MARNIAKLHHKVCKPVRSIHMCPDIVNSLLISGSKFAEANNVTVLTPTEVLTFNGNKLKITINKEAILQGWKEQKLGGL